jgi:2-polyprenyl-3-methyl-5-hydroxy-6-metoxy-1,4-benzoquinol methylase
MFDYYQCTKCRLVFMSPIPAPDEMRPFYAGGYQGIPKTLAVLRSMAKKEAFRMKPILKYKSGGKLLEIGSWMGIFSCNAKDAGFDVTAIDIDQECIDFLNDTLKIKAVQSSDPAETLGQMSEKFDVIAIWHALEHLPAPWLVVQKAAERLAPGGVLLIAIPNIESYEFSILKERWRHLDTPRHLYFYPADSLVALCQANGLTKLETTTTDELSDALSRDTWHGWATTKINVKYVRGILGRIRYYFERNKINDDSGSGLTSLFQAP